MTSGIDGVGGSYDFDAQGRGDANALVEPQAPFFPPGTKFMYWDEATQHYGLALRNIAGEPLEDLRAFLGIKLWQFSQDLRFAHSRVWA